MIEILVFQGEAICPQCFEPLAIYRQGLHCANCVFEVPLADCTPTEDMAHEWTRKEFEAWVKSQL